MPRFPQPRRFDVRLPLKVRLSFRMAGRDFTPGEPFDWRHLAIPMRRVRQLFDMGKIEASGPASESEPQPSPEPQPIKDDLDAMDSMLDLRDVAELEGAPLKRSKEEQRQAIRDHRRETGIV